MKQAYLEDAEQERVSERIRGLLQDRGALITEHTPSHVRFEGLNPDEAYSFSKGGYVGTYQHVGEDEVELRLRVRATLPAKIFWRTVAVELVIALLFFVLNPPSGLWFTAAALLYTVLLATFLLYLGTWRTSRQTERDLMEAFLEGLRAAPDGPSDVELEEERLLREFEEELEAEVAREALKRRGKRASAKGAKLKGRFRMPSLPRPTLRKRAPAQPEAESVQEKRRRLEDLRAAVAARRKAAARGDEGAEADKRKRIQELRAELERRKREGQTPPPE